MKALNTIILVLIVGLAIGSGITKILLIPDEVNFFTTFGLSKTIITLLGTTQLISGILIILKKTRIFGAVILVATFGFLQS